MNWEKQLGQFPSPADHFEEPGPRHVRQVAQQPIAGRLYWARLQDRSYLRRVGASTNRAFPHSPSIECHSRFGRGRGNGTVRRSTAVLCTSVVSWVEAGLRKAAIGLVGGGLGTEAALASAAFGVFTPDTAWTSIAA